MPRVGYVEFKPAGIKLPIHFNPKRSIFTCVCGKDQFEDKDIEVLRSNLLIAIRESLCAVWTPIIELGLPSDENSQRRSSLSFTKDRKYIGSTTLGYKQVHWDAQDEHRLQVSRAFPWEGEFVPPVARSYFGALTVYLPYTEDTWAELEEIQQYLGLAAKKLYNGLSSPARVSTLLQTCRTLFDHAATQQDDRLQEV